MDEIWKDIPDYEGHYIISNLGNIKSLKTNKILKQSISDRGYYHIGLSKNNKRTTFRVHRLVIMTFNQILNLEVNHIDGNKSNNQLDNLEYCSRSHNLLHAFSLGLCINPSGESARNAKLTDLDVIKIKKLIKNNISTIQIASIFNVHKSTINNIKQGNNWSHIKLEDYK